MNIIKFLYIVILFSLNNYSNIKYEKVASHIIDNFNNSTYHKIGIKKDTLIDINKDGKSDTVEFSYHHSEYKVNDTIYYALYDYRRTVMEEINGDFYIYDIDFTDSSIDTFLPYSVYKILNDFSIKKIIDFKHVDSVFVIDNNDVSFDEIKFKYLREEYLLECQETKRKLTEENRINYGWGMETYDRYFGLDQIIGEKAIGNDTLICFGVYNGSRFPYSIEYLRINSNNNDKYIELNKLLRENKFNSQTSVYKYNDNLVFYKHGWDDTGQPYEIIVVDYKKKDEVKIIKNYKFDYRYKITPIYDESKFLYDKVNY